VYGDLNGAAGAARDAFSAAAPAVPLSVVIAMMVVQVQTAAAKAKIDRLAVRKKVQ
jgi:hypothetical protein